jgi:hypothetical protein
METTVPRLRLTQGKAKHTVLPLTGRVTIGRLGSIELPVADTKASREHARVFEQGGDWHVVDLNSTNGTLVNGAKITRRALRPGDEITIGNTVLVFEVPEAPRPETPAAAATAAPAPASPGPAPMTKPPPEGPTEVVNVRPPKPDAAKRPSVTPAGATAADQIVIKQRSLQFHKIEGKKSLNPLLEDMGQRGGIGKLLVYGALILVAIVLFWLAIQFGKSLVSPGDDEDASYEEIDSSRSRSFRAEPTQLAPATRSSARRDRV